MRRTLWTMALVLAGYVARALGTTAIGGIFQPELGSEKTRDGVLRTFDENGGVYERRLAVFEGEGGALWIVSVQYFRRWYGRLLRNPNVEFVMDGEARAFRAVPVEEAARWLDAIVRERAGGRYYMMRATWLFAPWKPVRLDPI